jgi:hypothetical protein
LQVESGCAGGEVTHEASLFASKRLPRSLWNTINLPTVVDIPVTRIAMLNNARGVSAVLSLPRTALKSHTRHLAEIVGSLSLLPSGNQRTLAVA